MEWKGETIETYGDIMRKGMDKCDTPEEAQRFMALYRADNQYADQNVGYLSGYYTSEDGDRIREWFEVTHPVFGDSHPSPEEGFAKGQEWGRQIQGN